MSVNNSFTEKRSARRPRREVETEAFLGFLRRIIAAGARRVAEADEPELAELLTIRDELEAAISMAIAGQRARGKSWAAIARATGTTRQGAFQRWGDRRE